MQSHTSGAPKCASEQVTVKGSDNKEVKTNDLCERLLSFSFNSFSLQNQSPSLSQADEIRQSDTTSTCSLVFRVCPYFATKSYYCKQLPFVKSSTMYSVKTFPVVAIVLLLLVTFASSWPSGAPDTACSTLTPRHGENVGKSGSSSPFSVTQSQSNFASGDRVKGESK